MREEDLDIVDIILNNMPAKTEQQLQIKLYMQMNKTNCNYFLYQRFKKETTFFNTILKALMVDLGAEICRVLEKENIVDLKKENVDGTINTNRM